MLWVLSACSFGSPVAQSSSVPGCLVCANHSSPAAAVAHAAAADRRGRCRRMPACVRHGGYRWVWVFFWEGGGVYAEAFNWLTWLPACMKLCNWTTRCSRAAQIVRNICPVGWNECLLNEVALMHVMYCHALAPELPHIIASDAVGVAAHSQTRLLICIIHDRKVHAVLATT